MPTPPSEYIPLPAALRRRRPAYFCGGAAIWEWRGIQQPHSEDNRMIDENWAYLRARRNNIRRYRRLLQTELTELERR
jgi:hypothetical protein